MEGFGPPTEPVNGRLQARGAAAAVMIGPSSKTLSQLRRRLEPFIKVALPFYGASVAPDLAFDVAKMSNALDAFELEARTAMKKLMSEHPLLAGHRHFLGLTLEQQRELLLKQLFVFAKAGIFRFRDLLDNPMRWITCMESLYYHGIQLATKCGVNFGLFGATVLSLGTQKHIDKYADDIGDVKVTGGFALTELGHGSNARCIETTATYDPVKQEFVLNSPTESSQKFWIGNLGCHGKFMVVFAQLYVGGKHHGVHVFVVRVREEDLSTCDGVRTADCGVKVASNGIDNGRLWLDKKRVPLESLLDKFGTVTPEGEYRSEIASNTQRFTAMIGALVGGRVIVAQGALNMTKVGLAIAIRYAHYRRQFGPSDDKPEVPLMDYVSHQRRLLPLLASTYAMQFAMNRLKKMYAEKKPGSEKDVHVLAAGLKPACTWLRVRALQECREACGGQGFLAANRIGVLKNDADIDVSWEGDNVVLLQQVSSSLLKEFRLQVKAGKGYAGMLAYLRRQMELEIRDLNPYKKNLKSQEHLRDFEFYRHAMEYREARLLRALVNKLNKNAKLPPFEAWNQCMDLAVELAHANIDRTIVEAFVEEISNADPALQPMLHAVCSLHSLWTIQQNMGWFMTFRYFSPLKAKAIWDEINKLCAALRPHARVLVDAFDIPDALLDAPIAHENYVEAFAYPKTPGEPRAAL